MAVRTTPSRGGKPDKLMRDAIMVALKREAVDANGRPTLKLAQIAEKLVDLASEGDMQAIREVNDRIDGKAAQPITGEDGGPIRYAVVSPAPMSMEEWQAIYCRDEPARTKGNGAAH